MESSYHRVRISQTIITAIPVDLQFNMEYFIKMEYYRVAFLI